MAGGVVHGLKVPAYLVHIYGGAEHFKSCTQPPTIKPRLLLMIFACAPSAPTFFKGAKKVFSEVPGRRGLMVGGIVHDLKSFIISSRYLAF